MGFPTNFLWAEKKWSALVWSIGCVNITQLRFQCPRWKVWYPVRSRSYVLVNPAQRPATLSTPVLRAGWEVWRVGRTRGDFRGGLGGKYGGSAEQGGISSTSREVPAGSDSATFVCQNPETVLQTDRCAPGGCNCSAHRRAGGFQGLRTPFLRNPPAHRFLAQKWGFPTNFLWAEKSGRENFSQGIPRGLDLWGRRNHSFQPSH